MSLACTSKASGFYGQQRAALAATEDFGMLLLNAGLRAEVLLEDGTLSVEEARRLE